METEPSYLYNTPRAKISPKKSNFLKNSPKSLSGAVQLLGDHILFGLGQFLSRKRQLLGGKGFKGQPVPIAAAQQPSGLGMLVFQLSQGPSARSIFSSCNSADWASLQACIERSSSTSSGAATSGCRLSRLIWSSR